MNVALFVLAVFTLVALILIVIFCDRLRRRTRNLNEAVADLYAKLGNCVLTVAQCKQRLDDMQAAKKAPAKKPAKKAAPKK